MDKKEIESLINSKYTFIVNNMTVRTSSEKYGSNKLNEDEEKFFKAFLYQFSTLNKPFSLNLIRYSNGHLMIEYNRCQVGRFDFRFDYGYIQILKGTFGHEEFYNLTFDECLLKINDFIKYIKYHL